MARNCSELAYSFGKTFIALDELAHNANRMETEQIQEKIDTIRVQYDKTGGQLSPEVSGALKLHIDSLAEGEGLELSAETMQQFLLSEVLLDLIKCQCGGA